MKKQFVALLGGILVAGLAMAAEVVGNNEAVVIQKAAVPSSTGFQLLCVPVAPLNITGGEVGETMKLADVLPPELYDVGTRFTSLADPNNKYYVVQEVDDVKQWCTQGATEPIPISDDVTLTVGANAEKFWLFLPDYDPETTPPATVFCGQTVTNQTVTGVAGIDAYGNVNSEAKTLSQLISDPPDGSMVYVIEAGQSEYQYYKYSTTKQQWIGWNDIGIPVNADDTIIAAGEAFYYLKKLPQE